MQKTRFFAQETLDIQIMCFLNEYSLCFKILIFLPKSVSKDYFCSQCDLFFVSKSIVL